jgi:hypothetical protein
VFFPSEISNLKLEYALLATSTKASEWILESSLVEKAVFIDVRTKRPVVESFDYYIGSTQTSLKKNEFASSSRRGQRGPTPEGGLPKQQRYIL